MLSLACDVLGMKEESLLNFTLPFTTNQATDADEVAVLSQEPLNAAAPPGFHPWVHSFLHSSMLLSRNSCPSLGIA